MSDYILTFNIINFSMKVVVSSRKDLKDINYVEIKH